jgi:hypothetical protein
MIQWDWGQLEPETIEWQECLKQWKKSKILDVFIEDTDLEAMLDT